MKNQLDLELVDSTSIRKYIYEFYQIIHEMPSILMTITSVKVYKSKSTNKITVELITHRPGLIIGKGGRFINELILFIQNELEIDDPDLFELKLDEPDLWKFKK